MERNGTPNRFRLKHTGAAVILLVLALSVAQSQAARSSSQPGGKEDESRLQVLAADDRRMEALRRRDPEPLQQLYADDYTLVTPSGIIRSKSEQIHDLVSGVVRYRRIQTVERRVRIYGDVAIVLSRENYDILQNGKQVGGDILFTRTYKKFATGWTVIATHGTFVRP